MFMVLHLKLIEEMWMNVFWGNSSFRRGHKVFLHNWKLWPTSISRGNTRFHGNPSTSLRHIIPVRNKVKATDRLTLLPIRPSTYNWLAVNVENTRLYKFVLCYKQPFICDLIISSQRIQPHCWNVKVKVYVCVCVCVYVLTE